MNPNEPLRVLLVEDDEDDFILTRDLFNEIRGRPSQLEWKKTFDTGLEAMARNEHEVCLVDYRLGAHTGIELLRAAIEKGCKAPIILLTGQGEREIDMEAMKAGAADYLIKGRLDSGLLERSIRYAVERKRAAAVAASEQARLAAFGEDVGLALTRRDSLDAILHRCATAMVHYLHAAQARLWIYYPDEKNLKLHASAGAVDEVNSSSSKLPKVSLDIAQLAEGKPILISKARGDARVSDQEWAQREGIVAFAGYPLMLEDRLVGLMSIFARNPLTEAVLQEMASVANGIALCIERKRSAEALDASEVKYRSVVENIKEVIFQIDLQGRWTFLNPAWTEITGFHIKTTLGTHFAQYVHPEDRERHRELIQEVLDTRKSFCRDETRYLAANGSFRWMEVYAQPLLGNDGVTGITGTLSDITERKRAEAEIQKLAAFPRFNPDPVMELAADGTLNYLNHAAREMAKSLQASTPEAILPQNAAAIARECLQQGTAKSPVQFQINGRTLSWSFIPILASQAVHCYGADITERLNLESQFRHSQKLESIGQLAAGVAHDFNNILTIIQGHSHRLLAKCEDDPTLAKPLKELGDSARRGAALTRQLLTFSRKQRMQAQLLDLNGVIANMSDMLQRLLGDDIKLQCQADPNLPGVEADTGMIEQVVMNLSVNARDAMPKGGKLIIATSVLDVDDTFVSHNPDARAGRFVCLSVTDTGCGMTKETLNRIFEPFFTTKEVGKGTGLGLSLCYGIIKEHGGTITASSKPGEGATFIVELPITHCTAQESPGEERSSKNGGTERQEGVGKKVLVIDDEESILEMVRETLAPYGYQVDVAADGETGLRCLAQTNYDVTLCDWKMPGLSGRDVYERLRFKSRRQCERMIFITGDIINEQTRQFLEERKRLCLPKPFTTEEVRSAIGQVLAAA